MRQFQLVLLLVLLSIPVFGQDILGLGIRYSDTFREWEVQTVQEGRRGSMELRWKQSDDWSQWEFRVGDTTAQIRMKWRDDPNLWEIKCLGETVLARTLWKDDFRQWRLTGGDTTIRWQSRYGNIRDEWIIRDDKEQKFSLHTYWEGDPRDWVVEDNMAADEVPYAMRVAMIFLAVFNSVPKQ